MEEAIDILITAFPAYSCLAVPRRSFNSLSFILVNGANGAYISRSIPLGELNCKVALARIIKDLYSDLSRHWMVYG
ncbi:hypothetical protein [Pseudomonas sp. EpS/L25]|uniref:hypothetical protein n=1 Tax=Pseudomonas sp. EpS/L25 TaxID=1749078 RepID=UPI00128EBC10|nr:hypothetical protein [Pseudomonas sp. EpS/L25]